MISAFQSCSKYENWTKNNPTMFQATCNTMIPIMNDWNFLFSGTFSGLSNLNNQGLDVIVITSVDVKIHTNL